MGLGKLVQMTEGCHGIFQLGAEALFLGLTGCHQPLRLRLLRRDGHVDDAVRFPPPPSPRLIHVSLVCLPCRFQLLQVLAAGVVPSDNGIGGPLLSRCHGLLQLLHAVVVLCTQ